MGAKLDLQSIQCINLFSKVTGVRTNSCFTHNKCLFFVVEQRSLARAIGEKGANIKRLGLMLRQRVKVIPESNIDNFTRMIVQPVKFKSMNIDSEGYATIFAGQQAKASLIGRDKVRIIELSDILKQYFKIKGLRVI